jgi:hypothetical protein
LRLYSKREAVERVTAAAAAEDAHAAAAATENLGPTPMGKRIAAAEAARAAAAAAETAQSVTVSTMGTLRAFAAATAGADADEAEPDDAADCCELMVRRRGPVSSDCVLVVHLYTCVPALTS